MNIGDGIVAGSVDGILVPFSMENYYFATAQTSDLINITFDPVGEEVYSQTITLNGTGGNAQILLTGTGVPEPCLFIIYYLSLVIYCRRKFVL